MKSGERLWKDEMLAVAQSSSVIKETLPFCVGFEVPEGRFAVDFSIGQETEFSQSACHLSADHSIFNQLIRGEETLQVFYLAGDIILKGDSDKLLRLAFLFEECARALSS